jgi:hypothetical protein
MEGMPTFENQQEKGPRLRQRLEQLLPKLESLKESPKYFRLRVAALVAAGLLGLGVSQAQTTTNADDMLNHYVKNELQYRTMTAKDQINPQFGTVEQDTAGYVAGQIRHELDVFKQIYLSPGYEGFLEKLHGTERKDSLMASRIPELQKTVVHVLSEESYGQAMADLGDSTLAETSGGLYASSVGVDSQGNEIYTDAIYLKLYQDSTGQYLGFDESAFTHELVHQWTGAEDYMTAEEWNFYMSYTDNPAAGAESQSHESTESSSPDAEQPSINPHHHFQKATEIAAHATEILYLAQAEGLLMDGQFDVEDVTTLADKYSDWYTFKHMPEVGIDHADMADMVSNMLGLADTYSPSGL